MPFFHLRPLDSLCVEVVLLTVEQKYIHNFFFDLVSFGLIEKRSFSLLSTQSIRLKWDHDVFQLLTAKVKMQSELELSLVLENYPEYLKRLRLSILSMNFKSDNVDSSAFSKQIKKGIILERFLKFCEKVKFNSMADSWEHANDCLNQLEFILQYRVETGSKIIDALVYQYFIFLKARQDLFSIKLMKIPTEFNSGFDDKIAVVLSIKLKDQYEIFDQDVFVKLIFGKQRKVCLEKIQELNYVGSSVKNFRTFYIELRIVLDHVFHAISLREIQKILLKLALQSVKQLTLPLFKPRNEEEVLKDFVMLSKQLTHPADLPQVIIHFDHHDLQELVFRVILIRVNQSGEANLLQDLQELKKESNVTIERTKILGFIRKKFSKEACVLTFNIETKNFIREDHTIDFQGARLKILQDLMKIFGPIRDFEGGMIAKQAEAFNAFQKNILEKCDTKIVTLENFFYGIYPAEYRSLIPVESLSECFLWWKKEKDKRKKEDEAFLLFFLSFQSEKNAKEHLEFFQEHPFKIHQGFWVNFWNEGVFWLGCLIKDAELKKMIEKQFHFS